MMVDLSDMPGTVVEMPSPNYNERPAGLLPDMIVLHYTGMKTQEEALERLCNGDENQAHGRVSAHYTIARDGALFCHVDPLSRAWHAGQSYWRGREGLNDCSVGIELVNMGHEFGYEPFPELQVKSLISLMRAVRREFDIPLHHIVGHQDIAPMRKRDPGHLFPWDALAQNDLALSLPRDEARAVLDDGLLLSEEEIRGFLFELGFDVRDEVDLSALAKAFSARFGYRHNVIWTPPLCALLYHAYKIFAS
jgi:N-acetylmuramoyl-L-alanine amidase